MNHMRGQKGLTLVELMVAMVLGLVVIGGAISLTLANRQSYRTNEGLSQVQESARTAFELLARDLRQAGVSGCDNEGQVANVLEPGGAEWWVGWFGLEGHDGGQDTSAVLFGVERGRRVAGTDAVQLQGIDGIPLTIEDHDPVLAEIQLNAVAADIVAGDLMIACDFDHATIFQVSSYDAGAVALRHEMGVVSPGNCSTGLGFPTDCSSATGESHAFERNSFIGRFFATDWYIGQNGRAEEGGRSLFRRRLVSGGNELTEEVVAGVTDMQLAYRVEGRDGFEDADDLAAIDWRNVVAVRVELTVDSADTRVSSDSDENSGRIQRTFTQIITLRNRVP